MNMTKEEKKNYFKNVNMATTHFEIKIADFGFATIVDGSLDRKVGTSCYMAPELIKGKYGLACDVWSIGIITFMLLTCDMFIDEATS